MPAFGTDSKIKLVVYLPLDNPLGNIVYNKDTNEPTGKCFSRLSYNSKSLAKAIWDATKAIETGIYPSNNDISNYNTALILDHQNGDKVIAKWVRNKGRVL